MHYMIGGTMKSYFILEVESNDRTAVNEFGNAVAGYARALVIQLNTDPATVHKVKVGRCETVPGIELVVIP